MLRNGPWAEMGALNERGEFLRFLYIKLIPHDWTDARVDASAYYPWPFACPRADGELLLAHWHMHKFEHWPAGWDRFQADVRYCVENTLTNGTIGQRPRLYWGVATFSSDPIPRKLFDPVPQELINAFTRSDEARRAAV